MAGQSIMCVCSIHLESFLTWGHGRDCRVVLYVFPIYYSNNGFSIPYVLLLYIFREKRSWKNGLENTMITTNTSSIFQNITSASTQFVTTDNHISMISHSGTCLFYRIGSIFTTQYGEMLFQSYNLNILQVQHFRIQQCSAVSAQLAAVEKCAKFGNGIQKL